MPTALRRRVRLLASGAWTAAVALSCFGCTAAIDSAATTAPTVRPELHLTDMLSDRPAVVGESAGDGICELYCGIASTAGPGLPCEASYPCSFELEHPDGTRTAREWRFGPMADCMVGATSWGTVCMRWSGDMPAGWYRATLRCGGSSDVVFDFQVDSSQPTGFSIPSELWRESNRCPERPAFEKKVAAETRGE